MRNKYLVPVLVLALPLISSAATVDTIIDSLNKWMGKLLPILVGAALIVFLWGLITFIGKSGDETARTEGKQRMIWGVIALFVAVTIWGLVGFISDSTGIRGGNTPQPPTIPGAESSGGSSIRI